MPKICAWTFLFVSAVVRGSVNVSPTSTEVHCNDLCSNVDAYIPMISGKWPSCERGCRFFNIIFLTDGHNVSETKRGCHSSCKEAYNLDEFTECTAGCDATLEHIMHYMKKSDDPIMADVEIVRSEIFVDLHIPAQNINFNSPEFTVRTRPFERLFDEEFFPREDDAGCSLSWMDCMMKLVKVSRFFIFLVFISLFIIVFLWALAKLLRCAVKSDDKPLFVQEKEYCDSHLDEDENLLTEKEGVKIVQFLKNGQFGNCENPKA